MYLIIKATLYCNTQIYRPNTPYLAQRSVDSPCSNRVEARSFHSQVGPSLETVVLGGSDKPRYWSKGDCSQSGGSKIKNYGELQGRRQKIQLPKVIIMI